MTGAELAAIRARAEAAAETFRGLGTVARTDVPALLAEVKRLRDALRAVQYFNGWREPENLASYGVSDTEIRVAERVAGALAGKDE